MSWVHACMQVQLVQIRESAVFVVIYFLPRRLEREAGGHTDVFPMEIKIKSVGAKAPKRREVCSSKNE